LKKILNKFSKILGLFLFGIISFNSLTNLYENRTKIKDLITNKIKGDENDHEDHGPRYLYLFINLIIYRTVFRTL